MGIAYSQACRTPQECRNAYAKLFALWRANAIGREKRIRDTVERYGGQPYPYSNPRPPYAHSCFPTEVKLKDTYHYELVKWLDDIARIQKEIPRDCSEEEWSRKTSRAVAERAAVNHAIEFCNRRLTEYSLKMDMEAIVRDWIQGCHGRGSSCDTSFMSRGNEFVIQQANSIPLDHTFRIDTLVKQAFQHLGFTADGQPVAQSSLF